MLSTSSWRIPRPQGRMVVVPSESSMRTASPELGVSWLKVEFSHPGWKRIMHHRDITYRDLLKVKDFDEKMKYKLNWIQPKLDGMRILIRKMRPGQVEAWTRNGKNNFGELLRRRIPWLPELPTGSIVDCELTTPDSKFATDVITALKSNGRLQLTAFAAPCIGGEDFREVGMEVVEHVLSRYGVRFVPFFHYRASVDYRAKARSEGLEGYVAKVGHYAGWYRIKPVRRADLAITGIVPGKGANEGGIGALELSFYEPRAPGMKLVVRKLGRTGTGMSREFRFQKNPKKLIGQVAEVEFDSLTSGGMLRFAAFIRLRPDKSVEHCSIEA